MISDIGNINDNWINITYKKQKCKKSYDDVTIIKQLDKITDVDLEKMFSEYCSIEFPNNTKLNKFDKQRIVNYCIKNNKNKNEFFCYCCDKQTIWKIIGHIICDDNECYCYCCRGDLY